MTTLTNDPNWTHTTDVVIVGTGAAGLSAAVTALVRGCSVMILEKSSLVGGTTAVSGGVVWVPNNHHMQELGLQDSREEALAYMKRCGLGRSSDEHVEHYLDTAPGVIRFLEENTGIRFSAMATYPDYQPELEGGKSGGRALDNDLLDASELGPWAAKLRRSPITGRSPMRIQEAMDWQVFSNPIGLPFGVIKERSKAGMVHGGASLCGNLLKAILAHNTEPLLETAATELICDEHGKVVGLLAQQGEKTLRIHAKKGVILASGGFEWNENYTRQFLRAFPLLPASPPSCTGDGLKMAMSVGASLGNMSSAWWCPMVKVPEESYDGAPLYRSEFAVRCLPHSIIVNRRGQRFTSEAHNYNDTTKPFFHDDPIAHDKPNQPAWLLVDHQYMTKYMMVVTFPGRPIPEWITRAATLEELATLLGIDPTGLSATVERFNQFARDGVDLDFRRGESAFDRFYGDPKQQPNPNLGTLEQAPFYAVPIYPGTIGTNGGAQVNQHGQVIHAKGHVIPGLYAAGNVMAGITGEGYPGPGVTIGCALTYGHHAAAHACSKAE
jgi:3-oxosteroid 1-dehydrogenase